MEDERNEYKREISASFTKEIVAFLNSKSGGNITIGVADDGSFLGVDNPDKVQLKIKDIILTNISPSTIGLYEISHQEQNGKTVIVVSVEGGPQKPYYIREFGMSPEGCYTRIGSSVEHMDMKMIEDYFRKRTRNSLASIVSPIQELTFSSLEIYYNAIGHSFEKNTFRQLGLLNSEGKFNYVAYLLAERNSVAVNLGKYKTDSVTELLEMENYGDCCLVTASRRVLERINSENRTYAKISNGRRFESKRFDEAAVREAVTNAIVHNDYSSGLGPKFEIFSNRLEISSNGGLPDGVDKDDFLGGYSAPRNNELMRIFRDLGLAENFGIGIRKILSAYTSDVFSFFPHFMKVTIPFADDALHLSGEEKAPAAKQKHENIADQITALMKSNPFVTQNEMAEMLGVSRPTVARGVKSLIRENVIHRVGATKNGHWEITGE